MIPAAPVLFKRIRSMDLNGLLLALLFIVWTALSLHAEATSTVSATSKPASDLQGVWSAQIRGHNTQDEFNQRSLNRFRLFLGLDYQLTPWVKLNFSPLLQTSSGHSQTELETEANKNLIHIRNATADFQILQQGQVSAGALGQPEVHSALLMDDRAFPGVRAMIKPELQAGVLWGLFAQSTIPTSSSLSTNTKEFEPTPSFNSGGLILGYRTKGLTFRNTLSAFSFAQLPTAIATDSGLLGNTVLTTNTTDAVFKYQYGGLEFSSDLNIEWSNRFATKLALAYVKNSGAPDGLNQGYLLTGGFDYIQTSRFMITPIIQYFRVEPDAAVASYNDDLLTANRVGYRGLMKLSFSRKFRIYGGGGERGLIFQNPAQSRETYYELGLETANAKF